MTRPAQGFAVVSFHRGASDFAVISTFAEEQRAHTYAEALSRSIDDPELAYRVVSLNDLTAAEG